MKSTIAHDMRTASKRSSVCNLVKADYLVEWN